MTLTIYSKPDCHLCHQMKETVERTLGARRDVTVETIDISHDPALLEQYGLEVPVLILDGRKIARYRVTDAELSRAIGTPATLP